MDARRIGLWIVAALACVVSLSTFLPMQFAMVAGAGCLLAWGFVAMRRQRRLCAEAIAAARSVRGAQTQVPPADSLRDPVAALVATTQSLASELDAAYFKLVHTNIQLLALKELGSQIISALDHQKIVAAVIEYLDRGVGFAEFGVFTWSPDKGVFEGGLRRRNAGGFEWVDESFALPEVSGMLSRCLGHQRSYLIRDASTHPLGSLHGEPLLPQTDGGSYAVVPLLKKAPVGPIWTRKGCEAERCPLCPEAVVDDWVEKFANEPDADFWQGGRFRCWACTGMPLLGCIVVTDAERSMSLSRVDLVMLETLAAHVATVLENARLYEELQREERFRDHVIGSMSNGLVSVDLDGCITLFNQAGQQLSGYHDAEVLGRPSSNFIRDAAGRDPLREALEGERSIRSVEAVLHAANGATLPIQLSTALLRDEGDRVQGVIGEFADLSAIKDMQVQIRNLDKLAALGRLSSSIAHEIRNPLAGITAGIQYMTKQMQGERAQHAEFVLDEVDRLNRIIEDLFTAGRPMELRLRDTDMQALVERSLQALAPSFGKFDVRCQMSVQPGLPSVAIDPGRIEQVLINLIQNAVDASPPGGVVAIELRLGTSQQPHLRRTPGDSLVFSVHDQGGGISEADRERIFEPFFTTKSKGTGLGLYVCHHIVESHGGQIVVESRPGDGSCFYLCLPLGRILMGGPSETADLARR
ncbi:MAG TPA: ATP-binding protein [Candidatus Krumholzibacteria bacterium]|nr:ATP-binding protein [Candidatus Krumholzibacteria bacterium]